MKSEHVLTFNSIMGKQKFTYTAGLVNTCPFCERSALTDILDEDGPILLVKNKFQVIEDAYQTVLIETDSCDAEFSTYSKEHLHRLFHFAFIHWLSLEKCGRYASVILFKNHGPLSGGSIAHAHMQIIGFNKLDYRHNISPEQFGGHIIDQNCGVELNISDHPRVGFSEFNVVLKNLDKLDIMADYLQICIHYLLNHFRQCQSYNIFFYHLEDVFFAKVIPRFITSPIYIGYSIPQVTDRVEQIVSEIKQKYF